MAGSATYSQQNQQTAPSLPPRGCDQTPGPNPPRAVAIDIALIGRQLIGAKATLMLEQMVAVRLLEQGQQRAKHQANGAVGRQGEMDLKIQQMRPAIFPQQEIFALA